MVASLAHNFTKGQEVPAQDLSFVASMHQEGEVSGRYICVEEFLPSIYEQPHQP